MTPQFADRLEKNFRSISHRGPELADRFFAHLFSSQPSLRVAFPPNLNESKNQLLAAITLLIQTLSHPQSLTDQLHDLGARYAHLSVQPNHYRLAADTLLDILAEMSGPNWTSDLNRDWRAALELTVAVILEGHRAVLSDTGTLQ